MSREGKTLFMHEQLLLLALRDETGTIESKARMYEYALGGAILADLVLRGRAVIDGGKKALVSLVDGSRYVAMIVLVHDHPLVLLASHWNSIL